MWQISAVLRFCLSSFGFTITCGLLIAISLTRMFIIVKVTTYDPLISPPHLSANCVSQSEPRADFLRCLHQPRHPLPCLQLRLGRPLPKQRHGWVVQQPRIHILGNIFHCKTDPLCSFFCWYHFVHPCISDIILVIIGFYVGDEKADDGRLPFNILGTVVAGTMILSEVCWILIIISTNIIEI